MTITTNNVPRPLLYGYELTAQERKDLDYIAAVDDEAAWSEEHDRFFRYRGQVYDMNEFVRLVPLAKLVGFQHGYDDGSPLAAWHGIQTDSFFSAIVVRFLGHDREGYVIVGLALS